MDAASHAHLALEFLDCAFEDADQRAGAELISDGGDVLHALRFAESAHEAAALGAGAADQAPFREDHSPGKHAEGEQQR